MSMILDELMKFIKVVPTTKDLIYKKKIVDPHNIDQSYQQLVKEGKMTVLPYVFGEQNLYFQKDKSSVEEIEKLMALHSNLTNRELKLHENTLHVQNMMNNEIFNSLWIEGVRSSKKVIKQFLKKQEIDVSNIIGKYSNNYRDALNFISSTREINENNLFALYINLSRDIEFGNEKLDGFPYRLDMVEIGSPDNLGIMPNLIKPSLDSIFEEFKNQANGESEIKTPAQKVSNVIIIHYLFELIHPYYDMNGRMGRLFALWYASNLGLGPYFASFSEAINLYKNKLYYPAFKKSNINDFKFDTTYFVQSILFALVSQKIAGVALDDIDIFIKTKYKLKLNDLQRDIITGIASKDDNWYQLEDFVLGTSEINQGQLSKSITQLVEWGILEATNTKPKEYKFIWKKDFPKYISNIIETILKKSTNAK